MTTPSVDFGFAFNDADFSDRVLRIELTSESDFSSNRKRKKSNTEKVVKVTTLNVSSLVLAANSPFFFKLFKKGMKESQQKQVTMRINVSEEASLMDLLRFTYGSTLSASSAPDLVDVLIAADKFEVTSCMRHCVEMLLKLPMSLESALFYLELPASVLVSEIVKPLNDAAKQYVGEHYKDFTKSQEETMELPLSAVEAVLGSEGLQVVSEDDVFDFVLKWARGYYPKLEERREILTKRLARLIRFPNMSSSKLKEVLDCPDFDHEQVSKLVMEALFSKVELPWLNHIHVVSKDLATPNCDFSGRVYSPHCVVYFDIKRDQLKSQCSSKWICSQPFCLGGKRLYLLAQHYVKDQQYLGLSVHKEQERETCTLDYEFAVLQKSSKEFKSMCRFNNVTFEGRKSWGTDNLLGKTWTEFMSDDEFFVNDILHLRARITLKA